MKTKESDLPKSIVVILVVLAVAISLLGTFTVLNEMNNIYAAPKYVEQGTPERAGEIRLVVQDPNTPSGALAAATGKITFFVQE